MIAGSALSPEDVRRRIDELVPRLAERAATAEQLRRLPQETLDDVEGADLFRMIVPTSLGGHGLDLDTLFQATRTMAHGCVSTAWTTSFLVMHNWLMTRFPADARAEFFGGDTPWTRTATPLAPTGTFSPTEDGYRLTGRWDWATGIEHADWAVVHAVDPETPFSNRFFAIPAAEVTVDDIWFTSGMRGTGSNAIRVTDHHVPAHRTVGALEFVDVSPPIDGDGLAGLPMAPVLALMAAAPAVGAAEAAVELYRERVQQRVLAYSMGSKAIEQPATQMRLGRVLSEMSVARLQWDHAVAELASHAGGTPPTIERRAAFRLAASDTVRRCRSIIHTIAEGSGASVYFDESPFQRIERDIEVLKGHVIFDWDRTTELAGKIALGFEPGLGEMV